MKTELEAKFLDIDPMLFREKLRVSGAVLVHRERLMKRKVFDFPNDKLRAVGGWVRVRDEGNKITLSYKRLVDRTLEGTKEISVTVDNFETTCDFLSALGLACKSFQETRREEWKLGGAEVTIDTWPWIPPFVEIEAENEAVLRAAVEKLGFDWRHALHGSVEIAYQKYYDVTEDEIDAWETITFVPVPASLKIKQK